MADVLGFAGIGTCFVALVLAIVSLAINKWITKDVAGIDIDVGLWKYCADGDCEEFDFSRTEDRIIDSYRAVRAMIIIAILALPAAMVCVVLKMFVMKDKDFLSLVGAAIAGAAGLFLMIGMAVYAGELYEPEYKDDDFDLSAGFALDIVAWLLSWIATGLLILSKVLSL